MAEYGIQTEGENKDVLFEHGNIRLRYNPRVNQYEIKMKMDEAGYGILTVWNVFTQDFEKAILELAEFIKLNRMKY